MLIRIDEPIIRHVILAFFRQTQIWLMLWVIFLCGIAEAQSQSPAAENRSAMVGPSALDNHCQPSQPGPSWDEQGYSLRVLVTLFHSPESIKERGRQVSDQIVTMLPEFVKQTKIETKDGLLTPERLEVAYKNCLVSSSLDARTAGVSWRADLVIWGSVYPSDIAATGSAMPPVRAQKIAETAGVTKAGLIAQDGSHVSVETIRVGPIHMSFPNLKWEQPDPRFAVHATITSLTELKGDSTAHQATLIPPRAIFSADFRTLMGEEPMSFFRNIVAQTVLHDRSIRQDTRYNVAGAVVDPLIQRKSEVSDTSALAGLSPQQAVMHSTAENLRAIGLLFAGATSEGVQRLQSALKTCPEAAADCRIAALLNLAWSAERVGQLREATRFVRQAEQVQHESTKDQGSISTEDLKETIRQLEERLVAARASEQRIQELLELERAKKRRRSIAIGVLAGGVPIVAAILLGVGLGVIRPRITAPVGFGDLSFQ